MAARLLGPVLMAISGNLKTMALAELLQWLSQGKKSGTLKIDGGKVEKRIFFEGGKIVSSASTDPNEYLGHFLVAHGYVDEASVDAAVKAQKQEKKLLGQILVGMGVIEEEDLQQMLRLKAEESIYDVFTWEHGEFDFLDGELPAETFIRMELEVDWIVLEGGRRMDEWARIRDYVPSPQAVPVLVVDIAQLELEEVDRRILEWVDDDRSIEDISQGAQTTLFLIAQTLAEHAKKGRVKMVRPRIIEVPVEVPAAPAGQAAPPQMPQYPQFPPGMMPMINPYMMAGYDPPSGAVPIYAPAAPGGGMPGQPPPGYGGSVGVGEGQTLHFATGPATATAAPPVPTSEAQRLLKSAEDALRGGDFAAAVASFRKAKTAEGSDREVEERVKEGEERVKAALERDGISLSSVPKLQVGMDQLAKLDVSPQEGFMLTRLDGKYDIQSILKINPMPKVDALLLFWKLRKQGHVRC